MMGAAALGDGVEVVPDSGLGILPVPVTTASRPAAGSSSSWWPHYIDRLPMATGGTLPTDRQPVTRHVSHHQYSEKVDLRAASQIVRPATDRPESAGIWTRGRQV